jgi:hypothetical protein
MGRAGAPEVPGVRRFGRCHVYARGEPEDEVVAVPLGERYIVSRAPFEDWHAAPASDVRRLLAALLNAGEEDIGLIC